MRVGRIEVEPVVDGLILSRLPATRPWPAPGSPRWEEQHGMLREDGLVESTLGAFLVRTGDRVALVDAGGGPPLPGGYRAPRIDPADARDPLAAVLRGQGLTDEQIGRVAEGLAGTHVEQGALLGALADLGVQAEEVTDLVFTHLHFDHIGWASAGGSAVFPNATVRCAAADLDYFLAGPDEEQFVSFVFGALPAAQRLAPVLEHVETWESDGTLMPGVDVRLAPGHTPGSSVFVLSDGPARAMLLGDLVHCPLELTDRDFDLLVDHDPALARRVREAFARELEGGAVPAAAAHFPGLRFGRLLGSEADRRWSFDLG